MFFFANELENETTVDTTFCNTEPKAIIESYDDSFIEPKFNGERKRLTFDEKLEFYNMNNSIVFDDKASHKFTVESGFKYIIKPSRSERNKELVKPSLVEIKYTERSKGFMIRYLESTLRQIIRQRFREQEDYDIPKGCKKNKYVILHFDIENDIPQYLEEV